jgi:hypothetical protein
LKTVNTLGDATAPPAEAGTPNLSPSHISACFITKDSTYPREICERVHAIGFGELLFLTGCPSPHLKQRLFEKAWCPYIYYQDDDCLAPIEQLLAAAVPDRITCAMKPSHLEAYRARRIALLGWGAIFPKSAIRVLDRYRAVYGEDALFRRESERIMTYLHYPQQRLDLPIVDLPTAFAADRLSMQPGHYDYIPVVEERCSAL